MRLVVVLAIVLLAIGLGGCSSKERTSDPTTSESTTESISPNEPLAPENGTMPPLAAPADRITLNSCHGWQVVQNYPGPFAPGPRPSAWEPMEATELASVMIFAYACDRISIGPFERGPIHLLFEAHSNARVPAACVAESSGITQHRVLTTLVTDDVELVSYFQDRFLMPAHHATFDEANSPVGPATQREWSWTTPHGDTSVIAVLDDGQNARDPKVYEHYYWAAGEGLIRLELDPTHDGPGGNRISEGTLATPMLLGSDTSGHFVGLGDAYPFLEAEGSFTRFKDTLCTEAPA